MKFLYILLIVSFNLSIVSAQNFDYTKADKVAIDIPLEKAHSVENIANYFEQNLTTDEEKVRALYTWLTNNIDYDYENLYAVDYNNVKEELTIRRTLQNYKGICHNYAAIFVAICKKMKIEAAYIDGFTKQDKVIADRPHAWCAAKIDSSWYLFDPTWGGGVLTETGYSKRIDYSFYKIKPFLLIKTHMPFDPIWQMLGFYITVDEFYRGKADLISSKTKVTNNDTINNYYKLETTLQLKEKARRMFANGIKNPMLIFRYYCIAQEIEYTEYKKNNENLNLYIASFNDANNYYNMFIQARNKDFSNLKSKKEATKLLNDALKSIEEAKGYLNKLICDKDDVKKMKVSYTTSIKQFEFSIQDQKKYLATRQF